jgi:hypothetical protein
LYKVIKIWVLASSIEKNISFGASRSILGMKETTVFSQQPPPTLYKLASSTDSTRGSANIDRDYRRSPQWTTFASVMLKKPSFSAQGREILANLLISE